MTSGSHGKPYAGWTLPHISKLETVNRDFLKEVSARVDERDSSEADEGVPVRFAMDLMAQSYLLNGIGKVLL